VFALLFVYLLVRYKKAATWEMYFSQVFAFSKLAVLVCFFFMDNRFAVLYGLFCLGKFL